MALRAAFFNRKPPAIAAVLLCFSQVFFGQATQGTLLGRITDPSGASMAAAEVAVKHEGTNFERKIATDENGDYRVSGLESGSYEITVTAAGFKVFRQTRVDLSLGQIKRVDARLEVGDVGTTVTVEGGTSQVETEAPSLANVKTTRDYLELPLSPGGRPDMLTVTQVVAGMQSTSGFEVNGARDAASQMSADGISVNTVNSGRNGPNGFIADLDTLQEVKIITANSGAEYSQVSQFAAVTRMGENAYHGSLYWGNYNRKFSARRWQDAAKPAFSNNNLFVISSGGPVQIPRVYDGHDRTFYFFSYYGGRNRSGSRMLLSVPTPAFRQGDFSALLGRITILDPLTGQPFAGNRIPANRISPVSAAVQDLLYPDPNQAGQGIYGLTANYVVDPGSIGQGDRYSIRVDHKLNNKNTFFARFGTTVNNRDFIPGGLKGGYGQNNLSANHPGRLVILSDTHTFSPVLVNEAKIGYSRDYGFFFDVNYGADIISQIGLQGISDPHNDPSVIGMPAFTFSGINSFAGTDTPYNGGHTAQNTYQFIDNLSWYRGRHSLKMGFDVRHYQVNDQVSPQSKRGAFTFDDRLSGFAYANFLLGYPTSAQRTIARPNSYPRSQYYGFYVQDDLKLHHRVTLNYGVRYEYQTPWVDLRDRLFTFDPQRKALVTTGTSIPTDLVPAVAATLPIVSASSANLPIRSLMFSDRNNWSPRFGLAVRPFGNADTVVRLGYGWYTQLIPGQLPLRGTGGPWASNESFLLESNEPIIRFPNPFVTTSRFSGLQSINATSPRFPAERTQQWNASVGRQIWGTAVDVGYVGTKVKNIPYTEDLNLLPPGTQPYDPARRPFPLFTAANYTQTGGSSIYHGLTVQADRRMAAGLVFNVNYTLAKALTDVDLRTYSASAQQNQYQRFLERADDTNIRRQQLRFSYLYELPIGHGKALLNGLRGVPNQILGGWQLSGITVMLTGQRLSPAFSGADPANTNQFGGRPDRIGDGNFDPDAMRSLIKGRQPVFDIASFVRPATGRGFYGNAARYFLTGPGEQTWNIALSKNFAIRERARLQFRFEAFNAFNRANFSNPNTNISGGSFGLVTAAGNARNLQFEARLDY